MKNVQWSQKTDVEFSTESVLKSYGPEKWFKKWCLYCSYASLLINEPNGNDNTYAINNCHCVDPIG